MTEVIVAEKIYIKDAPQSVWLWCQDNLVVTNPLWETLKKLGKEDTIKWKHISQKMYLYTENGLDLTIPFGCLKAIWPLIKNYTVYAGFNKTNDLSNKYEPIQQKLYDYQQEAVDYLFKSKGGILQSAAGSGKTQIGIALIHKIGKRALWLTNKTDLLNQSLKRYKMLFPHTKVGTITDGKVEMGEVTFATVQTMANIDKDIYKDQFEVVVTDEVHRVSGSPTLSKMFYKVINNIPARYKYGLTATPKRQDTLTRSMYCAVGMNNSGEFKPTFIIDRDKTNQLTAKHIRVDLDTPMDYSFLNEDGTFNYLSLIDTLSLDDVRNDQIVLNIVKQASRHSKQLALCNRIKQCEILHQKLLDKGIKSVLLIGRVSNKKREKILNNKEDYQIIIGTFSLAKEGLDNKELSCLHLCTPISSDIDVVQTAGRIERVCENKPEPEIYDYVDKNIMYCVGKFKKRERILKRRK